VTPLVLLSASVDYATYLRQVTVACRTGASGVAAGRAVWQEAPGLTGEARQAFLSGSARKRMTHLTELCDVIARPWASFYTAPTAGSDWYASYPGF
jgi:tagatose 1,6-diphosphate aldolase